MRNRSDQFVKNMLRDALSRASSPETEVEVLAATQRIDVYSVPDPARESERAEMGLLGELSAEPSLFEPFRGTPNLRRVRRCICKQHTWHHELERRLRAAAGLSDAKAERDDEEDEAESPSQLPMPSLVIISPGLPETVLDAYGCTLETPGVYRGVWGLALRIVVLAELPRTRRTLLLRLLGSGRLLREALDDLAVLPNDAWEKSVAMPLLVHFRLVVDGSANDEEDDVTSAEIREWYKGYEQQMRNKALDEGRKEGLDEGRKEGERNLLLRQLRARFGELPAAAVARIDAASVTELERWGERVLGARTLDEVLDGSS